MDTLSPRNVTLKAFSRGQFLRKYGVIITRWETVPAARANVALFLSQHRIRRRGKTIKNCNAFIQFPFSVCGCPFLISYVHFTHNLWHKNLAFVFINIFHYKLCNTEEINWHLSAVFFREGWGSKCYLETRIFWKLRNSLLLNAVCKMFPKLTTSKVCAPLPLSGT